MVIVFEGLESLLLEVGVDGGVERGKSIRLFLAERSAALTAKHIAHVALGAALGAKLLGDDGIFTHACTTMAAELAAFFDFGKTFATFHNISFGLSPTCAERLRKTRR